MSYTYLIGWSNHNKWYYGRRTAKNCQPADLWTKYFTSSKYVREFREKNGEPDVIKIRRIFSDPLKCARWESTVLRRIDAQHKDNFLNMKNGDSLWDRTGMKDTEETRRKKSLSRIGCKNPMFGKEKSIETKIKISNKLTGTKRFNVKTGFKQRIETIEKRVEKVSKYYKLISPSGEEIVVKNLREYCNNSKNLCYTCMINVSAGKRTHHKGWGCSRIGK